MEKNEVHTVELVRKIRDEHYLALQGKTTAERIAFYQEQACHLHAKLAKKMRKRKTAVATLPYPSEARTGVGKCKTVKTNEETDWVSSFVFIKPHASSLSSSFIKISADTWKR